MFYVLLFILVVRRTVANPIVLILLAVGLVSALVSNAKYVGIIGDGGQEYQSFVTTLLMAALYFVVVNIPAHRRSGANRGRTDEHQSASSAPASESTPGG